ncbi:hypothetical protein K504DRAFT_491640 [Pleomassaria siparia CBS 279.74]|uniref:Uncharacterized protein n=1 Tax=Pleomassaria siparia CBS 279.74 TaxID=1314801 RepID=A0A6G1K880_9PLEO|nr:hypothetical protein K504DRAFT_491640 [Pleomassaria siparia CBS 279.74]
MHAFTLRSFALFIGLCVIIHALTIPVAHENALTLRQEASADFPNHADLERRDPKGGRKKPVTPNQRTKASPTPLPGHKKKPRPSPAPDKKKKPRPSPAPDNKKPAALLPFEFIRPSKQAYDVCNLLGFDCLNEDDSEPKSGESVNLAPRAPFSGDPGQSRTFIIPFSPKPLTIASKPYWTGPDLEDDSTTGLTLQKVFVDFNSDDIGSKDTYKVKATSSKPVGKSFFVTEHILELQTIKSFIQSVTRTTDGKSTTDGKPLKPIKLSQTVEGDWFSQYWNKRYPARVRNRPKQVAAYPRPDNPPDTSINDIVFEALGSKTNADDFVLCESSINSAKARLWANKSPSKSKPLKVLAERAASGVVDSSKYISVIRTALAVYDYMKLSEVDTRLKREIQHVKTELNMENIKAIVGDDNLPKDKTTKKTVDLAEMWEKYMVRHMARFERKGVDWLKEHLTSSLLFYQPGLEDLEKAEKEMKAEDDTQKQKRIKKATLLKRNARSLNLNLARAKDDVEAKEKEFLNIKKQVDAVPADKRLDEKKRLRFARYNFQRTAAKKIYNKRELEYWRAQREIIALDDKELPVTLKQVRAEVEQLKAFQAVVKTMDDELKDTETVIGLEDISITKRDSAVLSF